NSGTESTSASSTQTSGTNSASANSETSSSANTTSNSSSWPVEQQIFANAGPDKTVTVGADMVFEGKALGLEKKPIENARFLWNFGDGTTKEGKSVLYAYKYPGEYIVVLDVSSGYFSASDRVLIKAENSKIIISSLGTSQNNFIELTNPSNYDIDISLWMLRSGMTTFFLPARTYIAGNKKLIFASDTTKIIPQKGERVELLYPNGSLATLFELSGAGKNIVSSGSANSNRAPAPLVIENTVKSAVTPEGGTTSQMAAAVNPLAQNSAPSTYKWLLGLAAVALVSIFGVSYASYSPRTKKESAPQAKDFKIIEEE
ncbi:MAG: PKD domain-containing protein, partial [Patescibacteria group bacterium]